MCGEAPHYQARGIELTKKIRSTGLTGLYMDQIAMSDYQPCYQKALRTPDMGEHRGELPTRSWTWIAGDRSLEKSEF